MSNAKGVVWLAAVALVLAVGVAKAGIEKEDAGTGPQNWSDLVKGKISFKEFLTRESQRTPGPKCPEGYEWAVRGDEGGACWAKPGHGASVTCEIIGWTERNEGEGGVVRVPVLGKCTSSWGGTGGWAGNGPSNGGNEAP